MKKIIEKEVFGILAMTILLIPQIAHTVYVFEANSHYQHPWFSWCYALGVDLAILIFTVKGWLRTAFIYLFATLAHNLAYQFMPEGVASSILISVVQSTTIFSFCHLFFKKKKPSSEVNHTDPEVAEELMEIQRALEAGVRFKPQPFVCPECDDCFVYPEDLEDHTTMHKELGEWKPEQYGAWELDNDMRDNYCSNLRYY